MALFQISACSEYGHKTFFDGVTMRGESEQDVIDSFRGALVEFGSDDWVISVVEIEYKIIPLDDEYLNELEKKRPKRNVNNLRKVDLGNGNFYYATSRH